MRKKGSCQFAAYYKVERFDARIAAWKPIQKAFATAEEALAFKAKSKNEKSRIMKITAKGFEIYSI